MQNPLGLGIWFSLLLFLVLFWAYLYFVHLPEAREHHRLQRERQGYKLVGKKSSKDDQ